MTMMRVDPQFQPRNTSYRVITERGEPVTTNSSDYADLDKGLVIDLFAGGGLLGMAASLLNARIVVTSLDTYLRITEDPDTNWGWR